MTQFTVTKIDKHEEQTQVHMISDTGNTLRFFAGEKAWTFRAFYTGKITAKKLEKIIDVWYMFENKCQVSIGDKVTV
jgi:hypothetical protein